MEGFLLNGFLSSFRYNDCFSGIVCRFETSFNLKIQFSLLEIKRKGNETSKRRENTGGA